jgi:glycosyltransferase involved in cell wall biosynthesis
MRSQGAQVDEFTVWHAVTGSYDVLHLHWPEYYIAHRNPSKAYVGSVLLLLLVSWCRWRGAKVIWTVHNLGSHNRTRPLAEGLFWKILTSRLDGYISLNRVGEELIPRRFPALARLPYAVIPHGHYRGVYPEVATQEEARRRLKIPQQKPLFLFFGSISGYKGIPRLVETFQALGDSEVLLCIAGSPARKDIEQLLREKSREDPRIRIHLSRVPTSEVGLYFAASDVVVLPFSDIFNSGSAMLALSFDRPLLVPALGAMSELEQAVGKEWVRTYQGILTTRDLEQAMDWALHTKRPGPAPLEPFDWDGLAADTLRFYSAALGRQITQTLLPPEMVPK